MAKQGFPLKMPNITKRNPIADVEAELGTLGAQHQKLSDRKAKAIDDLNEARLSRKADLSKNAAADLTVHTAAVRNAEEEIETIDGVLADVAQNIAALEERLAGERDGVERERLAAELKAVTSSVIHAAGKIDDAAQVLGAAFAELQAAVPESLSIFIPSSRPSSRTEAGPISPRELAAMITGEALAKAIPEAFDRVHHFERSSNVARAGGHHLIKFESLASDQPSDCTSPEKLGSTPNAVTAVEAARQLVQDRLEKRAAAILSGSAKAEIIDIRPPETEFAPEAEVSGPAHRTVFVQRDLKFRTETAGTPTLVAGGRLQPLRFDVADAAVTRGVAIDPDTPRGAAAYKLAIADRTPGAALSTAGMIEEERCIDLGTFVFAGSLPAEINDHRERA